MKILILCTGNSCRSQMAEGFLKSFDNTIEVYSAGTKPSSQVHPLAIKAMAEVNIDISKNRPKSVDDFINQSFDYVITVCGGANESCPTFTGRVNNRWHIGFDDPAEAIGTEEEVMAEFRRIRDEIAEGFGGFYKAEIANEGGCCCCCS
ncbi:MAG TPA: arsenate reductase ArsC [Tenuifilaceae bacterium]|nr:arsenate reductase ArsC [Tenuifilaceae bacterium]